MTTIVQSRQPLQLLSMSNQPKRRRSERLAGMLSPMPIPAVSPARRSVPRARPIRPTLVLTYLFKPTMNKMATFSLRGAPRR